MQTSSVPTYLPTPFGASAGSGFIRTVPQTSQIGIQDGAASYPDGFVPDNAKPVTAGGVPPFMQDMNGILRDLSTWTRWYNAGGRIMWNAAFSASIGGYPYGSIIASATIGGVFWFSTAENNTTNPDAGGAGWYRWNGVTGAPNPSVPSLVAGAAIANMGFTPVQQGTGFGQTGNTIKLGWTAASKINATIDNYDWGYLANENFVNTLINNEANSRYSQDVAYGNASVARDVDEGNARYNADQAIYTWVNNNFIQVAQMLGDYNGSVGWQKFRNGAMMQWGTANQADQTAMYFPVAFPNNVMSVVITEADTNGWAGQFTVMGSKRYNNTLFIYNSYYVTVGGVVSSGAIPNTFNWIAMGY
jgi:hypothetical protein